ncbi:site-2 protease family protein [Lentibacter algarum]|uniref:site-2 protease family protein n=1 Tax=Lentibacter algarum TaxID=576131 RepID=UPI001C091562|nr:site-2 protease family protein [Lentibacter algarum]MBU2983611.1 site-2 protease family protein [Lentibacter algarum]
MFQPGPTIFSFQGLFGVRVEIAQSLILLAGLFLLLSGLSNFIWVGITVSMLLASIYLHELGHAWGCQVQGIPVRRIVLFGGGGFCEHARSGTRREQELIVAMGPIVNLALWALSSLGAWYIFSSGNMLLATFGGYLWLFSRINIALFVFNMLPVQPLDGGKLLQLTLLRFASQNTAMRVAGVIGLVFAVLWWPALFYLWYTSGWLLLFAPSIKTHLDMAKGQQRF